MTNPIGTTVHYVAPNHRCRPAIVTEQSALLAAQTASAQATARLQAAAAALVTAKNRSSAADKAVSAAQSGSITSAADAKNLADLLTSQEEYAAAVPARAADLEAATSANSAAAVDPAIGDLLDLSVITAGQLDLGTFAPDVRNGIVPLMVAYSRVAHDAAGASAGSWHTAAECQLDA